jgi:hypothetical protein
VVRGSPLQEGAEIGLEGADLVGVPETESRASEVEEALLASPQLLAAELLGKLLDVGHEYQA